MAVVILEREDAVGEAGRGSFAARAWRWALGEKVSREYTSGEMTDYCTSFLLRAGVDRFQRCRRSSLA